MGKESNDNLIWREGVTDFKKMHFAKIVCLFLVILRQLMEIMRIQNPSLHHNPNLPFNKLWPL